MFSSCNSSLLDTPYKAGKFVHYVKNYHSTLLMLVTCENILMGKKECLRGKQDRFNGYRETTG